jgi:RNA polymerase sigma-70 factor (ECF subfamily)
MLGSFADAEDIVQDVLLSAWKARASYAGAAPIGHWLMRIATNACLNELARRKRRGLPQLERAAATEIAPIEALEAADWLTPAPDSKLFAAPPNALEARESVALAFLALLQHLPPRQRAVLLLKDVVGWSADEIAAALELTVASVNSALHRARDTMGTTKRTAATEPPPDVLAAYVRSWEAHDVDALVSLLRDDIVFAMPPHATWFRGVATVDQFLRGPRFSEFWSAGLRVLPTRANACPALAFYARRDGAFQPSSIQTLAFVDGKIAEIVTFIGREQHTRFDLPAQISDA